MYFQKWPIIYWIRALFQPGGGGGHSHTCIKTYGDVPGEGALPYSKASYVLRLLRHPYTPFQLTPLTKDLLKFCSVTQRPHVFWSKIITCYPKTPFFFFFFNHYFLIKWNNRFVQTVKIFQIFPSKFRTKHIFGILLPKEHPMYSV